VTFPTQRLRRLRRTDTWRRAVRETALGVDDLVYPLFVVNGEGVRNPVGSMPGVEQLSIDELVKEAKEVHDLGIPAIILFGVPDDDEKDAVGSVGYDPQGLTIMGGLKSLGFDTVNSVRAGKYMEIRLQEETESTASAKVEEMCSKLLANPIVENYRFELEKAD